MASVEHSIENIRNDLLIHQKEDANSFGNIERLLESNTDILKRHDIEFMEMKEMIKSLANDSAPVNQWFKNINFGKKVIMGTLASVGSIIGIMLGIKHLLGK